MPKPTNNLRLPLVALLILLITTGLLSGCNAAPPTPTAAPAPVAAVDDCAGVSDSALIKEIADKVRADAQFQGQLKHIAVNSKDRVITLLGWAKGEAGVAALGQYANATKCVAKVNNLLYPKLTVGCGNDEEDCPGIGCVRIGQCTSGIGGGSGDVPLSNGSAMASEESAPVAPTIVASPSPSPVTGPKPAASVRPRKK